MSSTPSASASSPNGDAHAEGAVNVAANTTGNTPSSPSTSSPALWKEFKNQQGRPYWFHTVEKRSVWEKPDELKSARERAVAKTKWKSYQSGSRTYYVHSETKETTWSVPAEVQALFDAIPPEDGEAPAPSTASTPAPAATTGSASPAPAPASAPAAAPGPAPGPPPSMPASIAAGPPRPVYAGPPPGFGPPPPNAAAPSAGPSPPGAAPSPGHGAPAGPPPVRPPPTGPAAATATPPQLHPQPPPASSRMFASPQDAFKSLLSSKGVTTTWTWEQTMRTIVTEPLYKSLKSLAERKAVFNDYQADLRRADEEARARRKAEVRPAVVALLCSAADEARLKSYASWRTVMKLFGSAPEVRSAIDAIGEAETQSLWSEVQRDLDAAQDAATREMRHRNMDLLMSLLRTFEADTTTRWRDAHRTVLESSEWKADAHLAKMDVHDMLIVFEEYIRSIERDATDRRKAAEKERARGERKARAAFRELMAQGRQQGWITATSSWGQVYEERLKDDERFLAMLGQRGSTPLDLFFDALDACDRSVEARTAAVEALIRQGDKEWEGVKVGTTWDDFLAAIQRGYQAVRGDAAHVATANGDCGNDGGDDKWASVARQDGEMRVVYDAQHESCLRAERDARRRHERLLRHVADDARYGLKKSAPSSLVLLAEGVPRPAYDEVKAQLEELGSREWKRIEEEVHDAAEREEVKRGVWDKFCRRQREKAEERRADEEGAALEERERRARREGREERRRGVERSERSERAERDRGAERDRRSERDRDRDRPLRRREADDDEGDSSSVSRKRSRRESHPHAHPHPHPHVPPNVSTQTAASAALRAAAAGGGAGGAGGAGAGAHGVGAGGGDGEEDKEEGEV